MHEKYPTYPRTALTLGRPWEERDYPCEEGAWNDPQTGGPSPFCSQTGVPVRDRSRGTGPNRFRQMVYLQDPLSLLGLEENLVLAWIATTEAGVSGPQPLVFP